MNPAPLKHINHLALQIASNQSKFVQDGRKRLDVLPASHDKPTPAVTAPFTVLRLLTPLKMSYQAAKKRAEPYTKIVEELPLMRHETVGLVRKAVAENRRAYVLVNNRSEGNAPLTVQALTDHLLEAPR